MGGLVTAGWSFPDPTTKKISAFAKSFPLALTERKTLQKSNEEHVPNPFIWRGDDRQSRKVYTLRLALRISF